ncbi:MAG: hypothetical protein ACYS1A_20255 [Planctomycetota bacterium]|jgi:hypothetical protein
MKFHLPKLKTQIWDSEFSQRGVATFLVTILVLTSGVFIFSSLAFGILSEIVISRNALFSAQAYYAAEAGIEDAILRLQPGHTSSSVQPYSFQVGSSSATITVGSSIGGTRQITSLGNSKERLRRVSATASLGIAKINFFYGAQVGEGGLILGENSFIEGNVFSNGNIVGAGVSKSEITGTAKVAGVYSISDIKVSQDAYASALFDCQVIGTAHYVSSISNCPAGSTEILSSPPDPAELPIPDDQINAWKAEAALGGTLSGYTLGNNQTDTLGPAKIEGNMVLGNNSILTLTGTIWVTGTITFGNQPLIELDPDSYANLSGVIVADGAVVLDNNAQLVGTGEPGSFLMLLVTASGIAIDAKNTADGSVLYAPDGTIKVGNNINVREATAYGLEIGNNSSFTSGPSAGWAVLTWVES